MQPLTGMRNARLVRVVHIKRVRELGVLYVVALQPKQTQ